MAILKKNRNLEFTNKMINKKHRAGFFNTVSHDLYFTVLLKFYKQLSYIAKKQTSVCI